jgi:hypothetical protein
MKLTPDRIVCNLKAALMVIRELDAKDGILKELVAEIMQLPAMRALDWSITGSQLVEQIFKSVTTAFENGDPFRR